MTLYAGCDSSAAARLRRRQTSIASPMSRAPISIFLTHASGRHILPDFEETADFRRYHALAHSNISASEVAPG